jgi:hypothetical protein
MDLFSCPVDQQTNKQNQTNLTYPSKILEDNFHFLVSNKYQNFQIITKFPSLAGLNSTKELSLHLKLSTG